MKCAARRGITVMIYGVPVLASLDLDTLATAMPRTRAGGPGAFGIYMHRHIL
jgi:hypothetical protein